MLVKASTEEGTVAAVVRLGEDVVVEQEEGEQEQEEGEQWQRVSEKSRQRVEGNLLETGHALKRLHNGAIK